MLDKTEPHCGKRESRARFESTATRNSLPGRATNFMKYSFPFFRLARSHRINVPNCSHGAVSPCWREQRHESASAQRGDYNIYETRSWLVIAGLCFAVVSAA